jgi:serine/threonine-protein kinase
MPVEEMRRTPRPATPTPSSAATLDEGRFPPGTLLAGRYRISGLLGKGGMGEVYRATDLKLGQAVALKFLPESTSEEMLARFHAEVRIARQVSHPNVCRVYDIGEVDGATFLSMEYVDGEDLRSLLRRIGRLPGDKALEIARKLCAGLAAAHDKGVLHRDLKPANVMLDGRGQVLITDFGLAGLVGQVVGGEVRNGTPAYMAPEQLAGKEVSVRSDVYSLGLVLHEMFTGKRAFEDGAPRATPSSISSTVKDVDPLVERVILRCLDAEPSRRPASALAVAAALPGGDPLAAALAAGETPTPEMVAASEDTGHISVRIALASLASILAGVAAVLVLGDKTTSLLRPFENSPPVLEQKARDMIRAFGYTEPPLDRAYGFAFNTEYRQYAEQKETPATRRAQLEKGQPPLVIFWYRQSPRYLAPVTDEQTVVSPNDPPPILSGMVHVSLDTQGRLVRFDAAPPEVDETASPPNPPDWSALLTAAGVDMNRFTPANPTRLPLVSFDHRAAWTGSYGHAPEIPMRIEAASWRGKPVSFRVLGPWSRPARMEPAPTTAAQRAQNWAMSGIVIVVFGTAALLAWRNLRLGRGDFRGASRLAAFFFGIGLLEWLFRGYHAPTNDELDRFVEAVKYWLFGTGVLWMLYVALEPHVRRRWPQSLIAWSRVLGGKLRDPLVGGHLLIGVALGVGFAINLYLTYFVAQHYGASLPTAVGASPLTDASDMAGTLFLFLTRSVLFSLSLFFAFFLLRVLLRKDWLAAVVPVLVVLGLFLLQNAQGGSVALILVPALILLWGGLMFTFIRLGLWPLTALIFVYFMLINNRLTLDFSAWYAGSTMFALAVVLALTAYAFHTAVAGRRLFKEGFLDPGPG